MSETDRASIDESSANEEIPREEDSNDEKEPSYQFDVIVIGSGPGGYTSAVRCAQFGLSVAIVERDLLGGHAVNWGCIPINAMIASARLMRSINESFRYGIDVPSPHIDHSRIAAHRDDAIRKVRSQMARFLDKYRIQLYTGVAELIDANQVLVKPVQKYSYAHVFDANGRSPYETDDYVPVRAEVTITGKNIIIASGVEYELTKFLETDDRKIMDPTQLLWHRTIPDSLTIIGGGVLGCEFASLYSYLRARIVLIEKNSRLLKFLDEQVSNAVEKRLRESGVEIILDADVERISNGEVTVELRQTSTKRTISGDIVVVCTGRKPTFHWENLRKIGISIDDQTSTITIDEETCRTSIPNVYACGGVVASCWSWVPCAMRQGDLAAKAIAKKGDDPDSVHVSYNSAAPFVVNVIPAVASVGTVPKFADEALVYLFEFKENRRAIIDRQTWGFIKMWTTREEPKRFIAVQLVHEAAAEIIEYYSMIISMNISLRDVCRLPIAHPTYTESVKQACEYILGQSMSYGGTYLN